MKVSYEMYNSPQEKIIIDNAKKKFESSIASLGDLYALEKKREELQQAKQNYQRKPSRSSSKNKKPTQNNKIKQVNLNEQNFPTQTRDIITVNYLKPAKLTQSRKYSHVKSGKINPPKSAFSVKKQTDEKIRKYEENVQGITLYANRINITNYEPPRRKEPSPIKNYNDYPSDEENHNMTNNVMVIGQANRNNSNISNNINNSRYNNDLHNRTQNFLNLNSSNSKRPSTSHIRKRSNERVKESSKEDRHLQKQYDNLYSITKDFFASNSVRVPSKKGIEDIINNADEMRVSLEKYRHNLNDNSKILKEIPERPKWNHMFKDSIKVKKREYIAKSPQKKYMDINEEDRRKIEEKLETLHVEIRTIFDNMTGIENKNEKIEELIQKSQNLSNLLKSFSSKINSNVNLSPLKSHLESIKSSPKKLNIGESVNLENSINNMINKRNEVDEVIEVLKDNTLANINYDDNKIVFDNTNNNLLSQTSNVQNKTIPNMGNTNQSFYTKNNQFSQTIQKNPMANTAQSLNLNSNFNFNQEGSMNINTGFNNFNATNNMEKSLVNYAGTMNSFNNFKNNNEAVDSGNTKVSTVNQNNGTTNIENETKVSQNVPTNPYPKLSTSNVKRDDRFTAYEIEMPMDYYYNLTKNQEPDKSKEWYLRAHHTETTAKNNYAIPDDIMNTKYISYYAPMEKKEQNKNREEYIGEAITSLEYNIDKLKQELFTKAAVNKDYGSLYEKLEVLKEEAKKDFVPGREIERLMKEAKANAPKDYSDVSSKHDHIQQTNTVINSYETLLKELREKERNILLKKRSEQYEKIRPPMSNWWELKGTEFKEEMQRNKMYINANDDYFLKLKELKNDQLY